MAEIPSLADLCLEHVSKAIVEDTKCIRHLPYEVSERIVHFMIKRLAIDPLKIDQLCTLKIRLSRQQRVLSIRVNMQWSVRETIRQIYERASESEGRLECEAYGLFQPPGPFRLGHWLKPDTSLADYGLKPFDILDFKMRHVLLKVKFPGCWEKVIHPLRSSTLNDKTIKNLQVDESDLVRDLAFQLATKLNLPHPEEFGLKLCSPSADHGDLPDVGRWLDRERTLPEQEIDPLFTVVMLKRQMYLDTSTMVDTSSPKALHFSYCQGLDAVVGEMQPCTLSQAIEFASLSCQICFGDYRPQVAPPLQPSEVLPASYVGIRPSPVPSVLVHYGELVGTSEEDAKKRYIQLLASLPTRGHTFFRVQTLLSLDHRHDRRTILLGISPTGITILDPDNLEILATYPICHIRGWQVLHTLLTLFFDTDSSDDRIYGPPHLEFLSVEAEAISQVLSVYILHGLRESPSVQKRWSQDFDDVGRLYNQRRASRSRSAISIDSLCSECDATGAQFHKCRLYAEPKKIYQNPMSGGNASQRPRTDNPIRRRRLLNLIKILAQLSRKILRAPPASCGTAMGSATEKQLRVKFANKSVKCFSVSTGVVVATVVQEIAQRMRIKNTEEFSLARPGSNPHWLNPYQTLEEQGVFRTISSRDLPSVEQDSSESPPLLLFLKKFQYADVSDSCNDDPVYFNLVFYQSKDAILSGTGMCCQQDALLLAATLFQIMFGDHNPDIHKPGFLKEQDLKFFLAPHSNWGVPFPVLEKIIYKEHHMLRGIKESYAKFRYVQLCRSLRTYGATFFRARMAKCTQRNNSSDKKTVTTVPLPGTGVSLGMSSVTISVLNATSKAVILEHPVEHLHRWSANSDVGTLTLDFGDYEDYRWVFSAPKEAEHIANYISDYVDFIQTKRLCKVIRSNCFPPLNEPAVAWI